MSNEKIHLGWREWVALPELGVPALRAKLDTGARTSALHTFALETFTEDQQLKVRFGIHPLSKRKDIEYFCVADVIDRRLVKSSSGQAEERIVIQTPIQIGKTCWPIEITLTNREEMKFRMLLGRTAMADRIFVDPGGSYLTGRTLRRAYRKGRR